MMNALQDKNVLLGITAGIAAYKAPIVVRQLKKLGANVRVVLTEAAKHFVTPLTLQTLSGNPVHTDLFDLTQEAAINHIDLARWADLILIAPTTADFIVKLAHGHANDLLTTVCLATRAPIAIAPAMNRFMWDNIATKTNVDLLIQRKILILPIGIGEQACGEIGEGRMIGPEEIIAHISHIFAPGLLSRKRILITAGPTHEYIDPVRYISNPSTGKMGYAIAEAAAILGAEVTLISGPTTLPSPQHVTKLSVTTALEMHEAVLQHVNHQHVFIATAAVSDYRPEFIATQKIKKTNALLNIQCTPNPDILKAVSTLPNRPFCVGFAAETENIRENAKLKLKNKQLDMICVNDVSESNIGFGADENELTVLTTAHEWAFPKQPKKLLAEKLISLIIHVTLGEELILTQ